MLALLTLKCKLMVNFKSFDAIWQIEPLCSNTSHEGIKDTSPR